MRYSTLAITHHQPGPRRVSKWGGAAFTALLSTIMMQSAMAQGQGLADFLGVQTEPLSRSINTERPSFSNLPVPLASGHAQLEGGIQYTNGNSGDNTLTVPQGLLRLGTLPNLELQLGWAGYTFGPGFSDGSNDVTLAAKTQLTEQSGALPTIGLQPGVTLNTGTNEATSNSIDPSLGINWTYSLDKSGANFLGLTGLGLFGTVQFTSKEAENTNNRFLETALSVGTSFPLNRRLGGYVEYFGFIRSDAQDDAHNLDGGVTYLLSNNFQVDANGGVGISPDANDFFLGAGAAYRW